MKSKGHIISYVPKYSKPNSTAELTARFLISMSQKFSTSIRAASSCPQWAAACSGVQPSTSVEFTDASACNRTLKEIFLLRSQLHIFDDRSLGFLLEIHFPCQPPWLLCHTILYLTEVVDRFTLKEVHVYWDKCNTNYSLWRSSSQCELLYEQLRYVDAKVYPE